MLDLSDKVKWIFPKVASIPSQSYIHCDDSSNGNYLFLLNVDGLRIYDLTVKTSWSLSSPFTLLPVASFAITGGKKLLISRSTEFVYIITNTVLRAVDIRV